MNQSYIRLLQAIEFFCSEHLQINKFASDFPSQLPNLSTVDDAYPVLFVSPSNTIFDENLTTYSIDVYCYDIIQKDRSNINTILSDTNLILNDLKKWLQDGDVFGMENIEVATATPINNALLDYAAGWVMNITIEAGTYSVCEIPFNNIPVVSGITNEVRYERFLTCDSLSDCQTFIDLETLILDQVSGATIWKGNWSQQVYHRNEQVLDNSFLAIANKTTEDRPSPQPIGSPSFIYSGTVSGTSVNAKQVIFGNRYVVNEDIFVEGWRLNTVAGNDYLVYLVEDPLGTPIITQIIHFKAQRNGWNSLNISKTIIQSGSTYDLVAVVSEPDPTPTIASANWNYLKPTNVGAPNTGQIIHANKSLGELNIHKVDFNGVNRASDLSGLSIGDIIEIETTRWAIQSSNDNGTYFTFGISPSTQLTSTGVKTFNFETVTSTPITYTSDGGYWGLNPPLNITATGLLGIDIPYFSITADTTAYGIDFLIREILPSKDWDLQAFTSVLTAGGGDDSGSGTTLQGAYNNSTRPQLVITPVGGALQIKGFNNFNPTIQGLNTAGTVTYNVDGFGNLSATTIHGATGGTVGMILGVQGLPTAPGTFPIAEFNDQTGFFSDWNFRVAGGGSPIVNFMQSTGTLQVPSISNNTGNYGQLVSWGYNTGYTQTAVISFAKDGTTSTGSTPSKITFTTTPNGSIVQVERFSINNQGQLTINTTPSAGTTSDNILVRTSAGLVRQVPFSSISGGTGGTGSTTFTGGTVTGPTIFTAGLSANTISATTYLNLPASSGGSTTFTGGTITGPTVFTAGLSANTISATTYVNLPFWSAGTGTNGIATKFGGNIASGTLSIAMGNTTIASGSSAHAEGTGTNAGGNSAHAEGSGTTASGHSSHAEGINTIARGQGSHAEGINNQATGLASHVEGQANTASGLVSHAEGNGTFALAYASHAEGANTEASNQYAHAEGFGTTANAEASHAEGYQTSATGTRSHAEGTNTIAYGLHSHAEGEATQAGAQASHAEGINTQAIGNYSHAQNDGCITYAYGSHAGGAISNAVGQASFVHSISSDAIGDRSAVLGGQDITGNQPDTVYIPNLVIYPTIAKIIPTSAADGIGELGNITWDDNYLYVKTNNGWGRVFLDFGW